MIKLSTLKRKAYWTIYKASRMIRGQYSPHCPNFIRKLMLSPYPIAVHPKAYPISTELIDYTKVFEEYTGQKVQILFEIGCQYAQDAAYLCHKLHLKHQQAYVFEAHPQIFKEISSYYPNMNAFNYAVFNETKTIPFNCSDDLHGTGSSILTRATGNDGYHVMEVAAIRMDKFMEEHHIDHIDFLKLDVEGCNWEVLDSFGQKLSQVKSIHTEAEHDLTKGWKEGKSYDDIRDLLENHGFELFHFERIRGFQSDSFWINKRYLKKNSAN